MQIAFLGLGQMGLAIAQRLVEKGHGVTVWNRTATAAKPLIDRGATLAETAAEAVRSVDLVFTMLFDDQAVEEVLFAHRTLEAIRANAVHISLSTISVALAKRLETEHAAHHQRFLSVPVFGRPDVAMDGKLWLVIAGPSEVIAEVKPLLESFSRGHTIVGGQPSQANAAKLAGNFLIGAMIASFSEAITITESMQIDPAVFLETVNSAIFQSPFVANYGKLMISPPEKPGATIQLGVKDTRLFRDAAGNTPTPLADLCQYQLNYAIEAGRADEDWAAGYLGQTRVLAKEPSGKK